MEREQKCLYIKLMHRIVGDEGMEMERELPSSVSMRMRRDAGRWRECSFRGEKVGGMRKEKKAVAVGPVVLPSNSGKSLKELSGGLVFSLLQSVSTARNSWIHWYR